jgi:hypothetical protein
VVAYLGAEDVEDVGAGELALSSLTPFPMVAKRITKMPATASRVTVLA